jgi:hypothetical protein
MKVINAKYRGQVSGLPTGSLGTLYGSPSKGQVPNEEPEEATIVERAPRFTIVGMPPPDRLPAAPAPEASVASYVDRHPPQLDDKIVVDVDWDPIRNCIIVGGPK